jgi:hypothetical protein
VVLHKKKEWFGGGEHGEKEFVQFPGMPCHFHTIVEKGNALSHQQASDG